MKGKKQLSGGLESKFHRFLTAVVNIRYEKGDRQAEEQAESVLRRFAEFLPPHFAPHASDEDLEAREEEARMIDGVGPRLTKGDVRTEVLQRIWILTSYLRKIWGEEDPRRRNWLVYRVRHHYQRIVNRGESFFEPPVESPFEDAMVYLEEKVKRLRHCVNLDCPAPFFIARNDRPVTYCSSKCAGPAKRAAKRKWWDANRETMKKLRRTKTVTTKRARL